VPGLLLLAAAVASAIALAVMLVLLRMRPGSPIVRGLAVIATGTAGASIALILRLDLIDDAFEPSLIPFILLAISVLAIGAATIAASRS